MYRLVLVESSVNDLSDEDIHFGSYQILTFKSDFVK